MPDNQKPPAPDNQPGVPPPAPDNQTGVPPPAPDNQPVVPPPAPDNQPVVPPPAPDNQTVVPPPAREPAPAAEAGQPAAGGNGDGGFKDHFQRILPLVGAWLTVAAIALLGMGIVGLLVFGLFAKGSIVRELASVDYARGVITFIFAVGTMGIALLLTLGALLGSHTLEVFAKAKEVLTALIGVFGTILGFYFGTASGGPQKLDIADIRLTDKQLMTHVAGGTRPYRYSIMSSEKDFTPVTDQVSKDGWIVQPLSSIPKAGSITVDVLDGRDLKGSRELKLSAETPSPTPSPSTSATTAQPSPHQ